MSAPSSAPGPLSDAAHLVTLGQQRERVWLAHCEQMIGRDARAWHEIVRAYLVRLRPIIDLDERALLIQARDELRARLEIGWARPETARVVDHFERLLFRYEAICDALDGLRETNLRIAVLDRLQQPRQRGTP